MFHVENYKGTQIENYELVQKQLKALIEGEHNFIANLSNASALLNIFFTDINWVGFYLYEKETNQLVLGPFQGLPACIRIPLGRGVCGTSAIKRETIVVDNVHEFPGHIACSSLSNSEIVIPIIKNDKVVAVIDLDSNLYDNYDSNAAKVLEEVAVVLSDLF